VLLVGCRQSLETLSQEEVAELVAALGAFMEKFDWGSFLTSKKREERVRAIEKCSAYRNHKVTDFLLFDPVGAHP